MKEQGLSALEQLKEQQLAGCTFIVTTGTYNDDYQIEYVTGGWSFALAILQQLDDIAELKRVEVWIGKQYLGDWEEVIAKGEFDAVGKPVIEKGVRWVPNFGEIEGVKDVETETCRL